MSIVILSSAPVVVTPPPKSDAWRSLEVFWEGWDGSVWNLRDPDGGVLLEARGVEGLHFPPITKHSTRSRGVAGKRQRGWRAEAREVFWPLSVWAETSADWLARSSAFFDTIHPERPGIWRVKGVETRELVLTGVFDGSHGYGLDPVEHGWARYGVTLEAAQPFWQGPEIRRGPWSAPAPQPFFPGPPFRISAGSAFGSATVPNPGDVDAHGIWWVRGPLSAVELGVGDSVVSVPFAVPAGQLLRIDTDPRRPRAVMGPDVPDDLLHTFAGTNKTRDLGLQAYAPVPPGRSVPLMVDGTGTGSISFHLRPLYFRAF